MSFTAWHKEHPNWIGDEATYGAVHRRLGSWFGPASERRCNNGCGRSASNWAYDHRDPNERVGADGLTYSTTASHYIPLCISCHRFMDAAHKGQSQCGTDSGYYRHRKRGEATCRSCRTAHATATAARYQRRSVLTEYDTPKETP